MYSFSELASMEGVASLCLAVLIIALLLFSIRTYLVLRSKSSHPSSRKKETVKRVRTLVYFGSGGHTTEMIRLITKLSPHKYTPITFAIGHTDTTSIDKVRSCQLEIEQKAKWLRIYRTREVKQSWVTTIFTTIYSLIQALYEINKIRPALFICNGPGTCVPLAYSAFLLQVLGIIPSLKIIYIESYCRTKHLSLTSRLMLPIVDRAIVQWPELVKLDGKLEYIGSVC